MAYPGDLFGYSVSLCGDYAVIGAAYDDTQRGSAYIFRRSGASWMQEAKLTASDGASGDKLGYFVSINDDSVILGAPDDDSGRGSAYVFKRSGTSWTQEAKLLASDGAANDLFGICVSISGSYAFIGASGDDNVYGTDAGAAYVFKKPIADLDCNGVLSWTKVTPGEQVSGDFHIVNIGEATSALSWKIESYPEWGTWSITPSSGSGLTPEMGAITISVVVTAPNEKNQQFTGQITVVNTQDSTDSDTIPVSLTTPVSYDLWFQPFFARLLERFPSAFALLRQLLDT